MQPESPEHFITGESSEGGCAVVERRPVLLLEDDPTFREAIRDFLNESGYAVVAVENGGEGVREVLAQDFALILCDMAMPTLSGDLFYRAVERIRPQLCERFVFMTGYRNNSRANDFIQDVHGFVLHKPFQLAELLEAIAFAEAALVSVDVAEVASSDPVHRPANERPAVAAPAPAPKVAGPVRRAWAEPMARRPAPALPVSVPQPQVSLLSSGFGIVGAALFVVLAAVLGIRYLDARDRAAAAVAERLALEAEWRVVSPQAEQAEKARPGLAALPDLAKRLEEEHKAGWVGALRAVAINAGSAIELRGIAARGFDAAPGACEVRIEGVASGQFPRAVADEYHQGLRRDLERGARGPVLTQFEKLEDEPEPLPERAEGKRASFVITLGVDLPQTESGVTK